MTQKNKPQWDGKSRISNDLYRKNFIKIFGEEPPEEDKFRKEQRELEESYKQSLRNKKERDDKKI
jgi:hypothetical protein